MSNESKHTDPEWYHDPGAKTTPTKHTPGPWDVQNKGVLGSRSARHEVVAGVNVDGSKNLPTIVKMPDLSSRSYANAALIAAVPDLLKALKDAANEMSCAITGLSVDPAAYADAIKQRLEFGEENARAAIAKAEPKP